MTAFDMREQLRRTAIVLGALSVGIIGGAAATFMG